MKMKKTMTAIIVTAFSSAFPATVNVSTTVQLEDAVWNASSGDNIVLAEGVYDFSVGTHSNMPAHLYAPEAITLQGADADHPEKTVLRGSGARILYLTKVGCGIRNLTFENGDASGYEREKTPYYNDAAGGAIFGYNQYRCVATVRNCIFRNNNGGTRGGVSASYYYAEAYGTADFYDCVFSNNFASAGASSNRGGGAINRAGIVSNCTFVGNSFAGIVPSGGGGAIYCCSNIMDCVFLENSAGYGGATQKSVLNRCRLERNNATSSGGGAYNSTLISCTNVANSGVDSELCNCIAKGSVFLDVGQAAYDAFNGGSYDCCRFLHATNGYLFTGAVALTNCLIANAEGNEVYLLNNIASAAHFANCTIVSNSFRGFMKTQSGLMTMENCFFCGNTRNGVATDLNNTATNAVSAFINCIASAASKKYMPCPEGYSNYNYYNDSTFVPGFVGDKDPENPFAITRRSWAFKKAGVVRDWMATATDIRGEGFPRIRDGMVNIGCYQCLLNPKGIVVSFK